MDGWTSPSGSSNKTPSALKDFPHTRHKTEFVICFTVNWVPQRRRSPVSRCVYRCAGLHDDGDATASQSSSSFLSVSTPASLWECQYNQETVFICLQKLLDEMFDCPLKSFSADPHFPDLWTVWRMRMRFSVLYKDLMLFEFHMSRSIFSCTRSPSTEGEGSLSPLHICVSDVFFSSTDDFTWKTADIGRDKIKRSQGVWSWLKLCLLWS